MGKQTAKAEYRQESRSHTELPIAVGNYVNNRQRGPITMKPTHETHSIAVGYLLWLFGFTGAHRFY